MSSSEPTTTLTFLGTSTATPDLGADTASFVINRRYLVDTGWNSVGNLRRLEIDPLRLEYVIFTHFHHDHYLSLPSLLFYLISKKKLGDVRFVGPADDLEKVMKLSVEFLQADRFWPGLDFPRIIPLQPGETFENGDFRMDTCPTVHPVQSMCTRFLDKQTGKIVSFTGDTAYHPPLIEHIRGSDLLIHEASLGPVAADPDNNGFQHSGALDAARIAEQAGVPRLMLVHGPLGRAQECVSAAAALFSGQALWPTEGQTYSV